MPNLKFLSFNELSQLNQFHSYFSKDEEENEQFKKWFEDNCQAIYNETGFLINRRASGDNAFRAYMMAEKGFTLDQLVALDQMPKETLKGHIEDFFKYLRDPKLTKLQKIERIGSIHGKVLDKIVKEKVPEVGEIKSLDDLAEAQKKLYILERMNIDLTQDSQPFTSAEIKNPEYRNAYYKVVGNEVQFKNKMGKWTVLSKGFSGSFTLLYNPKGAPDFARAMVFDFTKDFLKKYGGKTIDSLPVSKTNEFSMIGPNATTFAVESGRKKPLCENKDAIAYLEGKRETYPGKAEITQYVQDMNSKGNEVVNIASEAQFKDASNIIAEPYVENLLTPEELVMEDLISLPPEKKQKLINAYNESLGAAYHGTTMLNISNSGMDEFDMIKNAGGKSIKSAIGNKYDKYDEKTKIEALKLETMRTLATEQKGLTIQYMMFDKNGDLKPSKNYSFKKIPDRVSISFADNVTKEDADEYFEKPKIDSNCVKAGTMIRANANKIFLSEKDIMEKFGLQPLDCIYVGDKSLREIYSDKYSPKEEFSEARAYAFLAAATQRNEPVFITALSEPKPGELKRTAVPIVFEGRFITTPEQSKKRVVTATRKEAQKIVSGLPERTPVKTVSLNDLVVGNDKVYSMEKHFRMIESMYGAESVLVPELVAGGVYGKDTFGANYEVFDPKSFTNEEFAVIAYFASMDPEVVSGNVWPEAGNLATQEQKVMQRHTFWTTDIVAEGQMPRENMGSHHWHIAIKPARRGAADAINSFSEGNIDKLADILANGIKTSIHDIKNLNTISSKNGTFSQIINMLGHLDKMVEMRGESFKEDIEGRLSADEKKFYKALIKFKEMYDARDEAENMLDRAGKNEIQLSDEEKQLCREQIKKCNDYARLWEEDYEAQSNVILSGKNYKAVERKLEDKSNAVSVAQKTLRKHEQSIEAIEAINKKKYSGIIVDGRVVEVNNENAADVIKSLKKNILSAKALSKLNNRLANLSAEQSLAMTMFEKFVADRFKINQVFTTKFLDEKKLTDKLWEKHNPNLKSLFEKGKYAKTNGYLAIKDAGIAIEVGKTFLSEEVRNEFNDLQRKLSRKKALVKVEPTAGLHIAADSNINAFNEADNKKAREVIGKIHEEYEKALKAPTEDMKPVLGFYKFYSLMLSPDYNFSEARYDNPYIHTIMSMFINGLNSHKYTMKGVVDALSDSVDPKTGRKAPFCYIADYYESVAELMELEQERQKLAESPSPEKEALYLEKLFKAHEKYLDNIERFTEFNSKVVDKNTGKSKYDIYFQNGLDMFTGTSPVDDEANRRHPKSALGWMRGMNQAIKNGWGMNDINVLGSLGYIEQILRGNLRNIQYDNDPIKIQAIIDKTQSMLDKENEKLIRYKNELKNEKDAKKIAEINKDIKDCNYKIKLYTNSIEKKTEIIKNYDKTISGIKSILKDVENLKDDVWNRQVYTARDKQVISENVSALAQKIIAHSDQLSIRGSDVEIGLKTVNNALEKIKAEAGPEADPFRGRKTEPVTKENLLNDQKIEEQKYSHFIDYPIFMLRTNFIKENSDLNDMIVEGKNDIISAEGKKGVPIWEFNDQDSGDRPPLTTLSDSGFTRFSLKQLMLPEQNKEFKKMVKVLYDRYKVYVNSLPDSEKIFRPVMENILLNLDEEKGNIVKAKRDNILLNMLETTFNFSPAIFRDKESEGYKTIESVKGQMEHNGLLMPEISYFEAVNDVLRSEYTRQQEGKNGWNSEKEQRYFWNLTKAYEKILEDYEEMKRFPMDIQTAVGEFNEDSLGDLTGVPDNKNRGLATMSHIMKWEMQAMKNGCPAEYLHTLGLFGFIEGQIKIREERLSRKIKTLSDAIKNMQEGDVKRENEEELKTAQESLKKLKEFDVKKFEPFKKQIWNKEIKGPEDILDILNIADKFYAGNKNDPVVTEYQILANTFVSNKLVLADLSNKVIEDVKAKEKDPEALSNKYMQTRVPKVDKLSRGILTGMRQGGEVPAGPAISLLESFIKTEYLEQLYKPDFPYYFDEKNPDYKRMNRLLDLEIEKYSREMVEKMALKAAEAEGKIGDPKMSEKDKLKAAMKAFKISGAELADTAQFGHHSTFYSRIEDAVARRQRKEGYNNFAEGIIVSDKGEMSLNDFFDASIKAVDKAPNPLTAKTNFFDVILELDEIYNTKTAFDKELKEKFAAGKDCTLDPKKFAAFKKKVDMAYKGISGYLARKNEERKKKGGNLSKNGEARYKAMVEARNAVYMLKRSVEMFNNNGPTAEDKTYKSSAYGISEKAVSNYKNFRNTLYKEDKKELLGKVDEVYAAQEKRFRNLSKNVDAAKEDIVRLAEESLYVTSVKNAYTHESKSVGQNEDMLKTLNSDMAQYVRLKGNSPKFKSFSNDYLSNKSFKNEFEKCVLNGAKKGEFKPENILRYRDDALKSAINLNKQNAAELNKLNVLSKSMGSQISTVSLGIAVPNVKAKRNPEAGAKIANQQPVKHQEVKK